MVRRRERTGWLTRTHEGVYAVGRDRLDLHGSFIAAVKACGRDAALTHRASAAYWGCAEWRGGPIDVTVRTQGTRLRDGVRTHRSKLLAEGDLVRREEMLVAKPAWALLSYASQATLPELRSAVRKGLSLELTNLRELAALLARVGPIRGAGKLSRVLSEGHNPTRSELENVVLNLILAAGFAKPDVNQPLYVDGRKFIPDFRWPEQRLIVEADGMTWHDNPIARADDAERQAILEASGERLIRVTWTDAIAKGPTTVARIANSGAPR